MGTILTVNLVTQSSIRADRVNQYMAAMGTMESAIASLRGQLDRNDVQTDYQGKQNNGYQWRATLQDEIRPDADGKRYIKLYRFHIRVFHDRDNTQLALTTVIADR